MTEGQQLLWGPPPQRKLGLKAEVLRLKTTFSLRPCGDSLQNVRRSPNHRQARPPNDGPPPTPPVCEDPIYNSTVTRDKFVLGAFGAVDVSGKWLCRGEGSPQGEGGTEPDTRSWNRSGSILADTRPFWGWGGAVRAEKAVKLEGGWGVGAPLPCQSTSLRPPQSATTERTPLQDEWDCTLQR